MSAVATRDCAEVVRRALAECAGAVDPLEANRWCVTLEHVWPRIDARARAGWLFLEAPGSVDGPRLAVPAGALDLLERNGHLPGGARFLLTGDDRILLRAEISLDEDIDLASRIREAVEGFRLAFQPGSEPAMSGPEGQEVPVSELRELCAGTGWEIQERGDGLPAVRLECADAPRHAILLPWGEGLRFSVDLRQDAPLAPVSRDAAWIFLLSASGFLRMVRPAVAREEGQLVPRFEVVFGSRPVAAELEHAFSALSVACQLCAEELDALRDQTCAREYLAIRGRSGWTGGGDQIRKKSKRTKGTLNDNAT